MFRSVCPLVFIRGMPNGRIELCVHDNTPFLPVELTKVFLGGATAVVARCVDFVVAVGLENVEDLLGLIEVADAGLLGAVADCHGAEDDIDGRFWLLGVQ